LRRTSEEAVAIIQNRDFVVVVTGTITELVWMTAPFPQTWVQALRRAAGWTETSGGQVPGGRQQDWMQGEEAVDNRHKTSELR
jgi:hypothetical protein